MTDTKDIPADIAKMSFEESLQELEGIVRKLEDGQGDLESSIGDYTRGTQLRQHCQAKLADAKLKVEKIVKDADGKISVASFEEN